MLFLLPKIRWAVLVILTFCFLYAFPLPIIGNSAYLALVLLFCAVLCSRQSTSNLLMLINSPLFILSIGFFLLIITLSLFIASFHNTYDYSIIKTLLNNTVSIVGVISIVSLIQKNAERDILDLLALMLVLQSFFIFIMLVSPEIRGAIQSVIRTEEDLERMASYGGVRGLGLSGSIVFGLSITMGILGFIMHYRIAYRKSDQSSLKLLVIFLICLIASLSAGRTAILGFAVGFVFYPFVFSLNKYVGSVFKQVILVSVFLSLLLVYIFNNEVLYKIAFTYSRYVFQFIWNYFEFGSFSVRSLEGLSRMYFLPENDVLLWGTGHYTNSDGTYFMHVDAGYMRFLLFFGGPLSLLIYLFFIALTVLFTQAIKSVLPGAWLFSLFFIFISFTYQYKGEVIFFSVAYMKIYFMFYGYFYLSYLLQSKNEAHRESRDFGHINA